jgi:hypothetical protein
LSEDKRVAREEITDYTGEEGFSGSLAVRRIIALIDEEILLSDDGVIKFDKCGTGSITVCVRRRTRHMGGRERGELDLGFVEVGFL